MLKIFYRPLIQVLMYSGIALAMAACGRSESSPVDELASDSATAPTQETTDSQAPTSIDSAAPLLSFNQTWIEGLYSVPTNLDLKDQDEVFWYVFSRMPAEVTVYPSENYYYWALNVDRQKIWGNIRLPTKSRDRGVLSFGYFQSLDYPFGPSAGFTRSKFFTEADGLRIDKLTPDKYEVHYDGRSVIFNLHQLIQEPPNLFQLRPGEVFVERTFDESGFQFFLIFNEERNYFIWVLNEEEPVPDIFDDVEDNLIVGKHSGFAFWEDGDRKVLVGVLVQNVTENNYYDGPFDQLADNDVDEIPISDYIERGFPYVEGRIDKYGYFTDNPNPGMRFSLNTYFDYYSRQNLSELFAQVQASDDPYHCISIGTYDEAVCGQIDDTSDTELPAN